MLGFATTFWIRRSIPRFSVCIVPTTARSSGAAFESVVMRCVEFNTHTATGAA